MAHLTGPQRLPRSGAAPDSVVVMLHGIGASGDDLIGLADLLAGSFPSTAFHAPHAPDPFDEAPFGYQWFSRRDDRLRAERVQQVEEVVNGYIDELVGHYRLEPHRCVLVGFSQGAIVALHVALRRRVPIGGIVAFSGRLVAADALKEEEAAQRTPVCLIHGADDPVLPYQGSEEAGRLLTELGVHNEVYILPGLAHAIDPRGIAHATRFMRGLLG